jgi:hypothetical protein
VHKEAENPGALAGASGAEFQISVNQEQSATPPILRQGPLQEVGA